MILSEGHIINQETAADQTYQMKLLSEKHIDDMLDIQDAIMESLPDKELFVPNVAEVFLKDLKGEGLTIGFFVEEKLKGFFSIHFVVHDQGLSDNEIVLGEDIDVPEEEWRKVARFRYSMVHPDYRGNSMCKIMSHVILDLAGDLNKEIDYLCTMVSPKNYPSLDHQFSNSMIAVKMKKNRKGIYRLIFFQNLKSPLVISDKVTRQVGGDDYDEILKCFHEGYYAFKLKVLKGQTKLVFGRPK